MSDQPENGEGGFRLSREGSGFPSPNGTNGANGNVPNADNGRRPAAGNTPSPFSPLTPPQQEASPFQPVEAQETPVPPTEVPETVISPQEEVQPAKAAVPTTPTEDGPQIILSLANVLRPIAPEILGFSPETIPSSVPVSLPLQTLKQQLPFGKIEIPPALLAAGCDDPYRTALLGVNPSALLPVPLQDVFHAMPEAEIAPASETVPPEASGGPFSQLSKPPVLEPEPAEEASGASPLAGGQILDSGFPAVPPEEPLFSPAPTSPVSDSAGIASSTSASPFSPAEPAEAPAKPVEAPAEKIESEQSGGFSYADAETVSLPAGAAPDSFSDDEIPTPTHTPLTTDDEESESAGSYGSLSGFLDNEEDEAISTEEEASEEEAHDSAALDAVMFRDSEAPASSVIHEDMEGLSGGELLSILESFAGGGQIAGLSDGNVLEEDDEDEDQEDVEDDNDESFEGSSPEPEPEPEPEAPKPKAAIPSTSFRDAASKVSDEEVKKPAAKISAKVDPPKKVAAPTRAERSEEKYLPIGGGLGAGFQCGEIPGQIELKAAFGVSRNLTAKDVVELCSELSGVEACVAVLPSGAIRPSLQRRGDTVGEFYDKAPSLFDHVFSLAEDIGIADAQILNIRNRADVRTFIKQGDAGLAVLHSDDVLAPGVREKLILATRELSKEMRI